MNHDADLQTGRFAVTHQRGIDERPITFGMCLSCRSVEVALNRVVGTTDLSDVGESDTYPVGVGCEVCA